MNWPWRRRRATAPRPIGVHRRQRILPEEEGSPRPESHAPCRNEGQPDDWRSRYDALLAVKHDPAKRWCACARCCWTAIEGDFRKVVKPETVRRLEIAHGVATVVMWVGVCLFVLSVFARDHLLDKRVTALEALEALVEDKK